MIVVPKNARVRWLDLMMRMLFDDTYVFKIRTFKNNIVPDLDTATVDLIESTYTGYSESAFTAGDNPGAALSGTQAQVLLNDAMYERTCTAAPETVYGWYLVNGDDDIMLVERYATPHILAVGSVHRLYPYVNLGKLIGD